MGQQRRGGGGSREELDSGVGSMQLLTQSEKQSPKIPLLLQLCLQNVFNSVTLAGLRALLRIFGSDSPGREFWPKCGPFLKKVEPLSVKGGSGPGKRSQNRGDSLSKR